MGSNINDGASDSFVVGITAMTLLKSAMTDDSVIWKNSKLTKSQKKETESGGIDSRKKASHTDLVILSL